MPEARARAPARRFCVAPMMDRTDRHERYLLRLVSRRAVLYTEMVTTGALIHGDRERLLAFDAAEHPVALQLGGSEPEAMARCARLGEAAGYDEININVGCPSDRVQSGRFGACLLAEPDRVAECVAAMGGTVSIPVTVKTRLGVDALDSLDHLARFVDVVARAGCATFIIHARKAWLKGLSPRQNREVPPLDYGRVRRLKALFPELEIIVNGGITSLEEAGLRGSGLDGVMVGRAAYEDPYMLSEVDAAVYGDHRVVPSRHELVRQFLPYVEARLAEGVYLGNIARHLVGLFRGIPGARAWRRHLAQHACRTGADASVLQEALARVPEPGSAMAAS